jgi:hemolysin D
VFSAAWSKRKEMDPPKREADELAFLPAHLELIETPVSPTARWTMRVIIALFLVALIWACIGKLDIVAVAPGRTVVDSRTKVVQPAETAVVRRILVRDGQDVKAGQSLVELDRTAAGAELAQSDDALTTARLAAARLSALAAALSGAASPELLELSGIGPERLEAEQNLATSQFEAYQAKRHGLEAAIAQRKAELRTTSDAIAPLAESARISKVRSNDYASLLEGKYVGRHDYLVREQERIAAESDLATQRNRLQEIRSALSASEEELRILVADFRQQTLDGLREARTQIAQATPELEKAGLRDRLMTLRAPVDGRVQQLAIHTAGGVVTPAQELLAIVPDQETLEVEATVLNKDIGFIRAGQDVTVKVDSFPYTRYGYITGKVVSISRDAAQDENLGLVFPARIRLDRSNLNIDGVEVRLTAGMSLTAEVMTGDRRIIDYLLSPLHRGVAEGLRER